MTSSPPDHTSIPLVIGHSAVSGKSDGRPVVSNTVLFAMGKRINTDAELWKLIFKALEDVEADEEASVALTDAFLATQEILIHSTMAKLALETSDTVQLEHDLQEAKQQKMKAARDKFENTKSKPVFCGRKNRRVFPYVLRRVGSKSVWFCLYMYTDERD